ncbi:MAG: hypothetical protein R3C05_19140 [Pirellulaceae bacterium]
MNRILIGTLPSDWIMGKCAWIRQPVGSPHDALREESPDEK